MKYSDEFTGVYSVLLQISNSSSRDSKRDKELVIVTVSLVMPLRHEALRLKGTAPFNNNWGRNLSKMFIL